MSHWREAPVTSDVSRQRLSRFGHTTTTVETIPGSEMLVVFGGVSAIRADPHEQHTALGDVAILHSHADSWETPLVTGEPTPGPRAFHCAAAVGRLLYVFGGHVISFDPDLNKKRRHFFQDLWKLDTDTWQWSLVHGEGAHAPPKRDMCCMVPLRHGNLLLVGGRGENGRTLGDCWLFEAEKGAWSLVKFNGPVPPPRKMHAMAVVNNRVLLFGGEKDVGVLDDMWALRGLDLSEPFRWTNLRVRPSPSPRFGHAMAVCGSRLVVFGGCLELTGFLYINRNYLQCRELWVLDIPTFGWVKVEEDSSASALPSERMCHSVSAFSDGRVLIMGGRGRERICSDSWWLDVESALAPSTAEAAAKAGMAQNSQGSLLSSLLNPLKGATVVSQPPPAEPSDGGDTVSTTTEARQDSDGQGSWLRVAGGVSSSAIGKISSAVSLGSLQSAVSSVLGDTAAGAINSTLGAMHPTALARLTGRGYSPPRKEPAVGWKEQQLRNAGHAAALTQLRATKFKLPPIPPATGPLPAASALSSDPVPALLRLALQLQTTQSHAKPDQSRTPATTPATSVPTANMPTALLPDADALLPDVASSQLDPVPAQDAVEASAAPPGLLNWDGPVSVASFINSSDQSRQSGGQLWQGTAALPAMSASRLQETQRPKKNTATGGDDRHASTTSNFVRHMNYGAICAEGSATAVQTPDFRQPQVGRPVEGAIAPVASGVDQSHFIEAAQQFLCNCPAPELTLSQLTVLLNDYKRLASLVCVTTMRRHLQSCVRAHAGFVQIPAMSYKFANVALNQIRVADVRVLQREYQQLVQQSRTLAV